MGLLLPFFLGELGVTLFCFVLPGGNWKGKFTDMSGGWKCLWGYFVSLSEQAFLSKADSGGIEYGAVWSFPLVTAGPLCSPQSYSWSGQAWAGLMGHAWAWAASNSSCQETAMSCLSRGVCPIWDELGAKCPKPLLAPIQGKSTTRMW